MSNGYDEHSLKSTGAKEAVSSSDAAPMGVAVRDKRFTRSGIGWRSPVSEATSLNPGSIGQNPPPIMFGDDYAGGTAARKRGQVDESKLPWETAQEATAPPIKPRVTLPPSGLDEALPPWLKDKDAKEEKESLPPWLKDKSKEKGDEEKESAQPDVRENWMGEDPEEAPECESFPDEEDAREALSTLAQFVDGNTLKAIQNQIVKQYGDPADETSDGESPFPGFMGEAAMSTKDKNKLPDSAFALPEDRAYPINDLAHARNALARVAQFGSAKEKSRVQSAVYRKFPQLKPGSEKK